MIYITENKKINESGRDMKAILFDLDGTLLDTSKGVIESAVLTAKKLGYEELPYSTMMTFIGPPIQDSFKKHYHSNDETAQKAANIFRNYYLEYATTNANVYPGVHELMKELNRRKVKIAVATYKREDIALKILKNFKLDVYCDVIHGADNFNKLTKTDIINICINEIDIDRKEVALVGDTEHDAVGALKAGISFIGVTYGLGFKSDNDILNFPNIGIVNNIKDILNII